MVASNQPLGSIQETFGPALRKARTECGLSQEELAFRSEVHRTYISEIERGVKNPSLLTVERLAHAMKIKVSTLIKQAEAMST
mgnify:CR=1 FL=1